MGIILKPCHDFDLFGAIVVDFGSGALSETSTSRYLLRVQHYGIVTVTTFDILNRTDVFKLRFCKNPIWYNRKHQDPDRILTAVHVDPY